jgi:hypothetical protein
LHALPLGTDPIRRKASAVIIEHNGIAQPVEEWALDYGIPADLIIARLSAGWTKAAAIEAPMDAPPGYRLGDAQRRARQHTGRRYAHDGQSLTLGEWAEVAGLPINVLRTRIVQGWTIARAVSTPFHSGVRARRFSFDGKSLTLNEWSALSGISAITLRARLRNGWTFVRAITEQSQLCGRGLRQKGGGYLPTSSNLLGTGGGSSAQDSG